MKFMFLAYFGEGENGNQFGGAEHVFANFANWMAQNTKHQVIFSSIGFEALPYPLADNIIYKHYDANLSSRLSTQISLSKNTRKTIQEFRPDCIISFSVHPLFHIAFQISAKHIPVFFSVRNDPKLENGLITRVMRYFVMNRANGIVFQTHDAQSYFSEKIKQKSSVIHNPLSFQKSDFLIPESFDNRIVFIGRLNPQKNIGLLLNAFSKICNDYPELILEIYGEGNQKRELLDLAQTLSIDDRVFFMGAHKDVLNRVCGARMFVLPSLYEGMPNALMEAMGLGIPVISADCPCGGPRELINEGENGYLFETNNVDDLILKMKSCLSNKNIYKISLNEREICKTHSSDKIFSQWIRFMEKQK